MSKKIIVIDHDQDTVDILSYLLSDEGYEVTGSISTAILDQLPVINPDYIFIDTWFPGNSKGELCRQIKLQPETAHIKVILLSTHFQLPELAARALADNYIPKPFDIDHVYRLTREDTMVRAS
jgi:CheY-like chemotaxis protein